jgi:hypothetical protein
VAADWQGGRRRQEGEEAAKEERGDVKNLHLQGAEAGAPRHRHLLQCHVHHELLHQRHLREARCRGRQARALQQEAHHHLRPPRLTGKLQDTGVCFLPVLSSDYIQGLGIMNTI